MFQSHIGWFLKVATDFSVSPDSFADLEGTGRVPAELQDSPSRYYKG
jgi:hypothetical protein